MVEIADDEDEFDDDTDLPLPNARLLPNMGTKGALLEEIDIETAPTAGPEVARRAPPPSASRPTPSPSWHPLQGWG